MFPLPTKIQKGYKFGDWTFYGTKHRGTDYQANYDSFYIPFPGTVELFKDIGGGNWLRLKRENGDQIEMAHLKFYQIGAGFSRAGNLAGVTGNTGLFTTNPHLHIQVKNKFGQYIDPEKYDWKPKTSFPIQFNTTILINKMNWDGSLLKKMATIQDWFWQSSNERIQLVIDYKYVELSNWETAFHGDNPRVEAITEKWYEKNILPLAPKADIVIFAISKRDWHGQVFDDPNQVEFGWCHNLTYPLKICTYIDENDQDIFNPELDFFYDLVRHEISHGLYGLGGKFGMDNTHKWFFERQFEKIFYEIDYDLLALNTRKIN